MAAPCIYEHAHDAAIVSLLAAELPYSISLLRRIQHGIAHPSPTAKILTTFPGGSTPDTPWLAARVDLFRGRETQIVLYSSLEPSTAIHPIGPVTPGNLNEPDQVFSTSTLAGDQTSLDRARAQLLALLAYIKTHLRPPYLSSLAPGPPPSSPRHPNPNHSVPLIPAPDPRAFLFGSLSTGLLALLFRDGVLPSPGADPSAALLVPGVKIHRFDNPPYAKFFFRRESFSVREELGNSAVLLPPGYRFRDRRGRVGVLPSQLELVQSRTHIPRSRAQLSVMPGVAIYWDSVEQDSMQSGNEGEDEMPIAWAFLGLDGALATLHVEPEHRGKGLALALSKETMWRGMDANGVFGSAGGAQIDRLGDWVHTEVAQYNQASRKVMLKIGGEVLATVVWTVIELLD